MYSGSEPGSHDWYLSALTAFLGPFLIGALATLALIVITALMERTVEKLDDREQY